MQTNLRLRVTLIVLAVLIGPGVVLADISITSATANQMANALIGGPTITVNSASYTGALGQGGLFTNGLAVLPFDTGVLLTTGLASNANGPNNDCCAGYDHGNGGDSRLDTLSGFPTFDVNILQFTFIPTNNVVSFQFVFASDEYNEWVNTNYNDVFAFYLNGVNIALVPGTVTPISIDTVNCLVNSQYYTNNDPFNGASAGCPGNVPQTSLVNLQYDGIAGGRGAHALFATGPVHPGQLNTIELLIADASDHIYDSSVFIAGRSFRDEAPPLEDVPEPASLLLFGTVAAFAGVKLRKRFRS